MMRNRRWGLFASLAVPTVSAFASPPPPPPEFVWEAGKLLADADMKDVSRVSSLFAADVTVTENGKPIATGKAAWLAWWAKDRSHYFGHTIGYSEGWGGANLDHPGGEMLVFDVLDTVDYSTNPALPGDPRSQTRSTYYRFGGDHLIHFVQIVTVGEYYRTPNH